MIEFILSVPLLALIILLTFFFGWGMKNKQHVEMASRFVNWRHVEAGGLGGVDLNARFFENQASSTHTDSGEVARAAAQGLVAAAAGRGAAALAFAEWLLGPGGTGPAHLSHVRGLQTEVAAEFQTTVEAWRRMGGVIHARCAREGAEWRRAYAGCGQGLRELFLTDLDNALLAIPAPGDAIGQRTRGLYLNGW